MRRKLILIIALATVAVASPAWAEEPAPTVFRFAVSRAGFLDEPAQARTADEKLLVGALFEGLTALDPDTLQPIGAAAKSWTLNADRVTYLFYLREEARWSNGNKVIADDFVGAWRRVMRQPEQYENAYLLINHINNARTYLPATVETDAINKIIEKNSGLSLEVEAISDSVLKITLTHPYDDFPSLLSLPLFYPRPSWLKDKDSMRDSESGRLLSNGAFTLTLANDQQLELTRNPNYWGKRQMQIDRALAEVNPNPLVTLQSFVTGRLDWTGTADLGATPPSLLKGARQAVRLSHRRYHYIEFGEAGGTFTSAPLRRALSLSVRRRTLQDYVMANSLKGKVGFYPRGSGAGPHYGLSYNPQAAKRELVADGYCVAGSMAACKNLPPIEIRHRADDTDKKLALAICNMWRKELAIDCKAQNIDEATGPAGDRAVVTLMSAEPELPVLLHFLERWSQAGGSVYASTLRQAMQEANPKKRAQLLQQVEHLLVRDVAVIPLLETTRVGFVSPRVLGFYKNKLDIHPLKYVYFNSSSEVLGAPK